MLTAKQQKWVDHLSDTDKITIKPWDPTAEEKFQKIREKIQTSIGPEISVEHHGATKLGISGQDEIDIYVPVLENKFNSMISPLTNLFGTHGSLYPLERARFETQQDGKHVTVFLVNSESDGWKDSLHFEEYLLSHPEALERYRVLKEQGNGASVREYYRRKVEFINEIKDLCVKEKAKG